MKKLLITLAVAGLTVAGTGTALATHGGYHSPCGSSVKGTASTTTFDAPTPGSTSGHTGIRGSNGYLEAQGNATTASGNIDGAGYAPGSSSPVIYGSVGGSATGGPAICVGAAGSGPHRLP